ncbi:hypothetical protein DFO67_13421 [Modicisalibacter xianhensis]|uniref:Uncharacterized protein n=1 Tax=Modicisalibacter xianhensis TaxID=442341 RepID=A0A4V6QAK5_9GAMM|nr:hypothetical protein [Halomonas xianhensis]TDX21653.1 hypothetical protein DFO67_13421 [Halomonas xianhensis]
MIIRRKAGKTLFWGRDLDPNDLLATSDGHLTTFRYKRGPDAKAIVGQIADTWAVEVGEVVDLGEVTMTLVKIDEYGAHWDVQAPRDVRILRDDAVRK